MSDSSCNAHSRKQIGFPFLFSCLVLILAAACGSSAKKTAKTETSEAYDYRNALQHYKVGINFINNKEFINAIQELGKAIELDTSNFRYHHGLGLAYSLNGQLEEAEKELKQALTINPNDSESYNLLGSIYTDMERYDEAAAALKKVLTDKGYRQPQFPYFNLGICMRKQGRNQEAIAAFQRVVQIDPKFYRAYIALAEIYKESGDKEKILHFYQKAEPGYSDKVDILFEIGRAMFQLRQYDKAKSYLAQVSILFPPPIIDKSTQDMLRFIEKHQRDIRN